MEVFNPRSTILMNWDEAFLFGGEGFRFETGRFLEANNLWADSQHHRMRLERAAHQLIVRMHWTWPVYVFFFLFYIVVHKCPEKEPLINTNYFGSLRWTSPVAKKMCQPI